uniref:Protein kinase domain-containing protein n=1 Tax=Setaria digitata TaxID=48799 RepID=A0A915PR03_9BILA
MDSKDAGSREGSCESDQNYVSNRLPHKNVLIKGRNCEFAIGRLISRGRFGAVFEVLRRTDGKRFAAKLETCDGHFHGLNMDYIVLLQASKVPCEHIAELIDHGKIEGHFKFIVMKMLGDNLQKLRRAFVECRFSLSTSLRLGTQTLAALEELHSMGFVHRDIKASNFAVSDSSESKVNVYILDFGLCRMYRNPNDGIKPPRNKTSFRGTTRYASLAAHREEELSPKDDLESWFYMLIEMISGELPWGELHRTDRKEIQNKKEECRSSDALKTLLKDCPKVEFRRILNYIDSLTYHSQPDHTFLTQMLQLAMKNYGVKMDEPFDWDDELQAELGRR